MDPGGVVTTVLSWAGGEQISLLQLLCIALCVIGVSLSSIHSDPKLPHTTQASSSISYAWLAAMFYGTRFWCTLLGGIAAILGYVFFKERRGKVQVSGVVLVLVGAFVLHLKT
jgi:drug/metabolite transporter (DMT)-like permease